MGDSTRPWDLPAAAGTAISDYVPQPRHYGFQAWTVVPDLWISGTPPTAGIVYVGKAWLPIDPRLPAAATLASFYTAISTAGVTGTAVLFFGVYNVAGTLLGKTADQGANTTSANTKGPYTLSAETGQSLTIPRGDGVYVWLAMLCATQNSGTAFQVPTGSGANAGRANVGITTPSADLISGSILTGQSTLPASITPANIAAAAHFGLAVA